MQERIVNPLPQEQQLMMQILWLRKQMKSAPMVGLFSTCSMTKAIMRTRNAIACADVLRAAIHKGNSIPIIGRLCAVSKLVWFGSTNSDVDYPVNFSFKIGLYWPKQTCGKRPVSCYTSRVCR
jgi:hypothetical protein